jgi:hypothetical protein
MLDLMRAERCDECGFDSDAWTDAAATEALGLLGTQWAEAISGLEPEQLQTRPIADRWSIAEYMDHVREVLFGMRFLLDSAINDPGIDLGTAPEPAFTPTPRLIDIPAALEGVAREASSLQDGLRGIPPEAWTATARFDDGEVDAHWICRHAIHDATHHLGDVRRLRAALSAAPSG